MSRPIPAQVLVQICRACGAAGVALSRAQMLTEGIRFEPRPECPTCGGSDATIVTYHRGAQNDAAASHRSRARRTE